MVAPRIVDLDDVDAVCQLDDALGAKVRSVAVERMRYVSQTAHLVHQVHHMLGCLERGKASRYEQADDFALEGLGFFADDRELRGNACQLEGAFDGVVIGQRDTLEPAFAAALDQLIECCPAVVRVTRVKVEVDPHSAGLDPLRERLLRAGARAPLRTVESPQRVRGSCMLVPSTPPARRKGSP